MFISPTTASGGVSRCVYFLSGNKINVFCGKILLLVKNVIALAETF